MFYDEPYYASTQKQRIYEAWQHFIHSGFNKLFFTDSLYKHLINHCRLPAHAALGGVGVEVGSGVANNGASSGGLVKIVSAKRAMISKMKALGFKTVP